MHISYNGITLELLTIDRAERRLIMTPDQTTVLYSEWALSLSCVYAPSLQVFTVPSSSADLGGTSIEYGSPGDANRDDSAVVTLVGTDPSVVNFTMPGSYGPIYTDKELHLRLSVPRKPLIIWGYDTNGNPIYWLVSPRPVGGGRFLPRDAVSGPIVQANVITANIGAGNLFGVQLEIKTWVPPCPAGSDRPILAHRWQMTHDQDENTFLTRTTTGEIYFHGGLMDGFLSNKGAVARQLFHPIPLGFRRQMGPVSLSPDGLVIRYSFADTEQKVIFGPGGSGATSMVITENLNYSMPFHGPLLDAFQGIGGRLRRILGLGDRFR